MYEGLGTIAWYSYQTWKRMGPYGVALALGWPAVVSVANVAAIRWVAPVVLFQDRIEAEFRYVAFRGLWQSWSGQQGFRYRPTLLCPCLFVSFEYLCLPFQCTQPRFFVSYAPNVLPALSLVVVVVLVLVAVAAAAAAVVVMVVVVGILLVWLWSWLLSLRGVPGVPTSNGASTPKPSHCRPAPRTRPPLRRNGSHVPSTTPTALSGAG